MGRCSLGLAGSCRAGAEQRLRCGGTARRRARCKVHCHQAHKARIRKSFRAEKSLPGCFRGHPNGLRLVMGRSGFPNPHAGDKPRRIGAKRRLPSAPPHPINLVGTGPMSPHRGSTPAWVSPLQRTRHAPCWVFNSSFLITTFKSLLSDAKRSSGRSLPSEQPSEGLEHPKTTVGSSVPGSDKVSVWLTGAAAPKKSTGTTDLRQEAAKIACLLSSLKLSVGKAQTTKWVAPFLEKL